MAAPSAESNAPEAEANAHVEAKKEPPVKSALQKLLESRNLASTAAAAQIKTDKPTPATSNLENMLKSKLMAPPSLASTDDAKMEVAKDPVKVPSRIATTASATNDPKYEKYAKMKKMGLPEGAIRQRMQRDGVDPAPFFGEPILVPVKGDPNAPEYVKFTRMLKCGVPAAAVRAGGACRGLGALDNRVGTGKTERKEGKA